MSPVFLQTHHVLAIHSRQLERFGGSPGVRDLGLLESALAQPPAQFAGEFLHEDLFAMGAAYLFHMVKNHPFVDGNKRTGLVATLVFLLINNVNMPAADPRFYEITMAVAEGRLDKMAVADLLRQAAEG